jgi:preprotein translocase subunit SecG
MIQQILLTIHTFLAFGIIGLVLLQHGKGAEAGAAFGSGASGTLFGSKGSGSFLTRMTTMLALFFAITSLGLGYMSAKKPGGEAIIKINTPASQEIIINSQDSNPNYPEQTEIPD